jgi:4-amino-4-deoxy-L-arabinose transferase-like glycosyltransferase
VARTTCRDHQRAISGTVEVRPATGRRALWGLALAALLIVSRWPLAPRYLITFDAINFALAVENFNPALHQPQPPGDPLFVWLLKLLSRAMPRVETVFLAAALLVSLAALVLVWAFGDLLTGSGRGIIAALLLLFHPAFWLAALTNPVRLCYAAGATGAALALFLACRRRSRLWLLAAAAALGVGAGFRPSLAIILAPLVLWTVLRFWPGWKMLAAAMLVFLACTAAWLPVLAASAGGWQRFYDLLRSYSYAETHATSILLGAPAGAAAHMAWEAIVWSCLGTLSWLWAIPCLALQHRRVGLDPLAGRFLLFWFLPGLLFYAAFHVGDADHTLAIVPATCLAGAAVLSSLTDDASARARVIAVGAAVLLNVLLFLKPIGWTARASTYKPVRWLDHYIAGVVETVGDLQKHDRVTAIFYQPVTGWRNLSYYFPEVQIIVVRQQNDGALGGWLFRNKRGETWSSADGAIRVPSCGVLAWVDPDARPWGETGEPAPARRYPVSFLRAAPGMVFQFRDFRFVTAPDGCAGKP